MTHFAEGPATKSGALGVGLARASIATLQHYAVILWAVTALTTVYLIVLPPGADVITGLAWADLEALQGHFPISQSDLWLSRGIGYKALLYLAEGLSRFVAGDALRVRIAIFNGLFVALAVGVLSGASWAFLLRRDPGVVSRPSLRDRAETLALAALCFVPAVIWSWAQDTHISVLLCVLGIGLVLSPSARAQWCSGIVLFLLFSIKGVTALDFLFVLATAFATGDAPPPRPGSPTPLSCAGNSKIFCSPPSFRKTTCRFVSVPFSTTACSLRPTIPRYRLLFWSLRRPSALD